MDNIFILKNLNILVFAILSYIQKIIHSLQKQLNSIGISGEFTYVVLEHFQLSSRIFFDSLKWRLWTAVTPCEIFFFLWSFRHAERLLKLAFWTTLFSVVSRNLNLAPPEPRYSAVLGIGSGDRKQTQKSQQWIKSV